MSRVSPSRFLSRHVNQETFVNHLGTNSESEKRGLYCRLKYKSALVELLTMVNGASCTSLSCSGEGKVVSLPGIKEGAIQARAIVMIPEEVPTLTSALTVLGDYLVLDGNTVLGVMEVQQCNVKDEGRLPRDVFP